jgi:putative flippase GtrA
MIRQLSKVLSLRFVKFCAVGASGVLVNLSLLAALADGLGIHVNLASALAIEASINSNFIINELWTFRDRRRKKSDAFKRLVKFHLVSAVGGVVQWSAFILCNMAWVGLLGGSIAVHSSAGEGGILWRYIIGPILHPPEVGALKYISQLLGIGVATFWNYFVNFYWTWAWPKEVEK